MVKMPLQFVFETCLLENENQLKELIMRRYVQHYIIKQHACNDHIYTLTHKLVKQTECSDSFTV
jgi:hypothetical protein